MKKLLFISISWLLLASCEKMQFDDPGTYTLEEASDSTITPDYYFKLAAGNFQSALFNINDAYYFGTGLASLADQTTVTNRVQEWWDFAKEPRISLNNTQSYTGVSHFSYAYDVFYKANLNANIIIEGLASGKKGVDAQGRDRTQEIYAIAYFIKAISQGYLGMLYDRGVVADQNLALAGPIALPDSYKQLIESSAGYFDKAITAANAAGSITLADFYPGVVADKARFVQFTNSMAARVLASLPRDKAEAAALGATFWNKVLAYANAGLSSDFISSFVTGGYYNYHVHYALTEAGGGPYLPADIKVAYMADKTGTYPNSYPLDESVVLAPVQTDDARFVKYFKYVTNFGYLRVDRGRNLFSNYKHNRWSQGGSNPNTTRILGYPNPVFLLEELRLLRSEAKMWLGDMTGAAAELNAASADRIAIGKLPAIAATEAAVRATLHYEYAISIDLAGGAANPWTFMRRNNLLQKGTPTELPVPEQQLLLTGDQIYTFGGFGAAGAKGMWGEVTAATGDGAWR